MNADFYQAFAVFAMLQGQQGPVIDRQGDQLSRRQRPADKPWIISSKHDIEADKATKAEFVDSWLEKHPFPGQQASYQVKLAWVGSLRVEYETELMNTHYMTKAPEPHEIAAQILMEYAPDTILVGLRMSRSALETLVLDTEDQRALQQGLSKYGLAGYKGESRSWEAYKKWLLEISQPLLKNGTANDKNTTVLIGSIDCNKSDILMEKCVEFAENLGLRSSMSFAKPMDFVTLCATCHKLAFNDKVGEFLYHPIEGVMGFQMEIKLVDPAAPKRNKESIEFIEQLDALKEKTKSDGDPKEYIVVPKSDPGEDQPYPEPTAENHFVLWYSAEYANLSDRIQEHFILGKGECRSIQQRLQKGNTDAGNLKIEMFQAELNYLKHRRTSYKSKFSAALALTQAASCDTYWIIDNESPDAVAELLGELAKYWRTILLKKDDATIGLSLGASEPEGNQEMSDSRQALYHTLEMCTRRFEGYEESEVSFNWKPVNKKHCKKIPAE